MLHFVCEGPLRFGVRRRHAYSVFDSAVSKVHVVHRSGNREVTKGSWLHNAKIALMDSPRSKSSTLQLRHDHDIEPTITVLVP